ncbi:MAG: hypothetical protein KGL42_08715 [Betaproteobacteria bacterium]|nr:hypothetical protein [Betaproteobacteria bacterium]
MTTNAFSQAVAGASLAAITAAIGANAQFDIYGGTVPADSGASTAANTLLMSGTISSWGTPTYSSGLGAMVSDAVFSASSYGTIASGTATFAKTSTSGSVGVRLSTVTATGGGGEVQVGNINFQTGVNETPVMSISIPCDAV